MKTWAELSTAEKHALYQRDRATFDRLRAEREPTTNLAAGTSLRWRGKLLHELTEHDRVALMASDVRHLLAMTDEAYAVAFERASEDELRGMAKTHPERVRTMQAAHTRHSTRIASTGAKR